MKKVSIMVPCYNEQENVVPMHDELTKLFQEQLPNYEYEILFIDNCSTDLTRVRLREIAAKDRKTKVIFNARNFGQFNSPYYGMLQTTGDCVICVVCDFQDPLEMIPVFLEEWENGYKIVCGIKTHSKENPIYYLLRTIYYRMIKGMSEVQQIEHFTGFGLYDRSFIKVLKDLDDPTPFLREIVAELGYKRKDIPYTQPKRRAGKTHNNWYSLYDAAMLGFTSSTKIGLRICTFFGFSLSFLSILTALGYLILKLIFWSRYPAGSIPILLGVFIFGSLQLFFTGFTGEYIMSINNRMMHRPLVIEEERLNFSDDHDDV
ncbi:MAG: glycosyltransferase [Lachnospiraceae bacterium]|nr:glycosyltransferase [Lachnospiraceae bacterium]